MNESKREWKREKQRTRITDKYFSAQWCRWTAYHFAIKLNTICILYSLRFFNVSLSFSICLSVAMCVVVSLAHFFAAFNFQNNSPVIASFNEDSCIYVCGRTLSAVVEWNVDSIKIYVRWYIMKDAATATLHCQCIGKSENHTESSTKCMTQPFIWHSRQTHMQTNRDKRNENRKPQNQKFIKKR